MGEAACRGPVSVIPRALIWLSTGLRRVAASLPAPSPLIPLWELTALPQAPPLVARSVTLLPLT